MMDLSIKNMVCDRCIKTVTTILIETGIRIQSVHLGKVIIQDKLSQEELLFQTLVIQVRRFQEGHFLAQAVVILPLVQE